MSSNGLLLRNPNGIYHITWPRTSCVLSMFSSTTANTVVMHATLLGFFGCSDFVINILRSKLLDLNIPGHASISQWKFLCSSLFFKNTWVYRSESSTMTSSLAFPPGPCRNLKAHVVTKQTHRCHFSDLHHTFLYLDLKSQHLYNG